MKPLRFIHACRLFAVRYRRSMKERDEMFRTFWSELLDRAKSRTRLHTSVSPRSENRLGATANVTGNAAWVYALRQHDAQVELFRRGQKSERAADRYQVFDALHARKAEVEAAFGGALLWQRRAGDLNWHIAEKTETGGYLDNDRWPEIQEEMVSEMIRLEAALRPFLDSLTL
jgi:hypothetical protein